MVLLIGSEQNMTTLERAEEVQERLIAALEELDQFDAEELAKLDVEDRLSLRNARYRIEDAIDELGWYIVGENK